MPEFLSEGVSLHYELVGPAAGWPTVLVHGFASDFHLNWVGSRWVDGLVAAGRRVIGLDCRGHGQSAKPHASSEYGIRMVEDVRRLAQHLGLAHFDYLGYSMGGRIGLRLLVDHPDLVRRAVLAGIGDLGAWAKWDLIGRRLAGDETVHDATADIFHRFAASRPINDLQALAACMNAPHAEIPRERLATIKVPTLIAVGDRDDIAMGAEALAADIPTATLFMVPGRDHTTAVTSRILRDRAIEFLDGRS